MQVRPSQMLVLLHVLGALGGRNEHDVRCLLQQLGDGGLSRFGAERLSQRLHRFRRPQVDQALVSS